MNACNIYSFIEELRNFEYKISYLDRMWDVIFCDTRNKWNYIKISKYNDTFYIFDISGTLPNLELVLNKYVRESSSFEMGNDDDMTNNIPSVWDKLIAEARKWLKITQRNWIKSNQHVHKLYPLKYRKGVVFNSVIRESLPNMYRIDKELGIKKMGQFITLVEEGYFYKEKNSILKSMTANDFFKYCKIAYIHGQTKGEDIDETLSGREMYKRYADGRDEGLLEIKADSKIEFANWIDGTHPKKSRGGHPWEIKRGGNTTHISLYVSRPSYGDKDSFQMTLAGGAMTRLKETICMFLGIHAEGLPIKIADAEGIRKRLLAQDNIGIIPCFSSLHRANQDFHEHQEVYEVLYYDELGRYKRRITPFISWEPLQILKPLG